MAARRRSGSATRPTSRCVFTQPTEKISQFTVDVLRYIAGELKTSDITEGTYVDSWAEAAKKVSTTQQILPQMPKAELDKRTAAVFGKTPVELRPGRPMSAQVRGALLAATEKVSALQSISTVASNNQATVLARMEWQQERRSKRSSRPVR